MNFKQITTLLVLAALALNVHASGDAEKGKTLSATCAACHGTDGNSINPIWPSIAGQHPQYIERQLHAFKSGDRPSANMAPMVASLSEQDMVDLSAYFAAQTPKLQAANPELVELGQSIYQGGIKDRSVPACMACHGPTGQGNPLSGYPVLASQHAAYTVNELKLYRGGRVSPNKDDVNGHIMADVAKAMTDQEIEAVASYIQGLKAAR